MKNSFLFLFLSLLLVGLISGCGGGGGSAVETPPTKAAIVVSSSVSTADQIGSVNFTFELPAGVTVPADVLGEIPHSNLFFSGVGSTFAATASAAYILGKFTPAAQGAKATVSAVVNTVNNSGGVPTGMNPGSFATLICDIAPGATVRTADFTAPTGVIIANTAGSILYDSSSAATPSAALSYSVTLY